jgi:uncharacterized membrane protein YphA (DoxX/SURF4 family)
MQTAIKPVINPKSDEVSTSALAEPTARRADVIPLPDLKRYGLEARLLRALHKWSIPSMRVVLGVVFLWFGALKLFGISPVASLVQQTCGFVPFQPFFLLLALWEIGIGCGLILKRALRFTLALMVLHLAGTFFALLQVPSLFFSHNNPLYLTMQGEFVIKNLILVTAALVVAGYEVRPRNG